MMNNEIWNKRRERLEDNLVNAALELMAHTGANSGMIPIKDTTPELVVFIGEKDQLK
jgi:hypothetical protein